MLINSFKLEFLGFILEPRVKRDYSKNYVNDKKQVSLENWDQFEKLYPNTFKAMYQFWLRRSEKT